jgi:hypothetical protein
MEGSRSPANQRERGNEQWAIMDGPTHGLSQDLILLQLGDELPDGAVRISDGFLDVLGGNRPRRRGAAVDIALASYLLVHADYLDKMKL